MLQIVFNGRWYENNSWFKKFNWRQKKESVYFYDYDDYVGYIIQHMDYSVLQRFRLNLYNCYKDFITFKKFWEIDKDWNRFRWYDLSSDIIEINNNDFASLIPDSSYRKKFFIYDDLKEKYVLKGDFISFIKTKWLSM